MSKQSDPIRTAYAVAQQRAARAVAAWAIEDDPTERTEDIAAVYASLVKGWPDPAETLHAGISDNIALSDTVGEVMTASQDAGYFFGLAVGLALKSGGAQ